MIRRFSIWKHKVHENNNSNKYIYTLNVPIKFNRLNMFERLRDIEIHGERREDFFLSWSPHACYDEASTSIHTWFSV